jgi:hypothetical protein
MQFVRHRLNRRAFLAKFARAAESSQSAEAEYNSLLRRTSRFFNQVNVLGNRMLRL